MKQELFNIGEYEGVYEDIDRLDYRKLEDLNGDNLFFAFLKENEEVTLNCALPSTTRYTILTLINS